jgi:hypothetical protein
MPLEQPEAPGVEMVIEVAAMAPVLSAVPLARAHLPTARSVGVAVPVVEKVVVEVKVTVTLDVALVEGLSSLTVTVEPLTAVTDPDAAANDPLPNLEPPNPPAPAGREPEPGVKVCVPPPGGVPPPGRPPNPPVHDPETGWETDTVVAVTGPPNRLDVGVDPVVGLPKAEMHEPTVTAADDVEVICRNMVAGV